MKLQIRLKILLAHSLQLRKAPLKIAEFVFKTRQLRQLIIRMRPPRLKLLPIPKHLLNDLLQRRALTQRLQRPAALSTTTPPRTTTTTLTTVRIALPALLLLSYTLLVDIITFNDVARTSPNNLPLNCLHPLLKLPESLLQPQNIHFLASATRTPRTILSIH